MSVYERSEKKSHLDTLWYEIAMLSFCYGELKKRTEVSEPMRNLLIEGALLHYRNLLEFCSGAKHRVARNGKPADISTAAPQVWAGRELTAEELAKIQAPARLLEAKYFDEVSQFLQHCSERRFIDAKQWDLDAMMAGIKPIVEALRQTFGTKPVPREKEVLLSTNQASTASISVGPTLGTFPFGEQSDSTGGKSE
jgi:hypothetical protein